MRAELKQALADVDLPAPDRDEIECLEETLECFDGLIKGSVGLLTGG
jgi:hypothetical protein